MTAAGPVLEIHVFGGSSKGECIIIKFPQGNYGVVDSCLGDSDSEYSPPVKFLKDTGVSTLSFVCLTHPHNDHFAGMLQFFEEFKVREFWHSSALSQDRLRSIVQQEIVDAKQMGDKKREEQTKELVEIYKSVAKLRKRPRQGKQSKRQRAKTNKSKAQPTSLTLRAGILGTKLYPFPRDDNGSASVTAIAPSEEEKGRYEQSLAKCFSEEKLIDCKPLDHNKISLALLVKTGKTVVVLGGDTEAKSWESALRDYPKELAANLVKVSHHGSKEGHCKGLWESFCASDTTTYAVCTGYKSSGLPKKETLDHISNCGASIYLTHRNCLPKLAASVDDTQRSRTAVNKFFTNLSPKTPSIATEFKLSKLDDSFGKCSFTFDSSGKLISVEAQDPAVEVT